MSFEQRGPGFFEAGASFLRLPRMLFVLAGSEGFEPSLAVLETDVLAVDTKTQGEALLRLELLAPLDNLLGVAARPDRSNQ